MMRMPDGFRLPGAADRDTILKYTRPMGGLLSCEYAFANLLSWGELYQLTFCEKDGLLWLYNGQEDYLYFPLGGEVTPAMLREASETMRSQGLSGIIDQVPVSWQQLHAKELAEHFDFRADDRFWDYVYSAQKLAELPGEKLGKKRNLLKQFEALYPGWTSEALRPDDARVWLEGFVARWAGAAGREGGSVDEDIEALHTVFECWDMGGFAGRVVRVNGEVIAFCVYSCPTDEMAVIHFEKALRDYKGGSQIINRETARFLASRLRWINREQDLGVPGLRQAKQSYDPDFQIEVGFLEPK